MRSSLAISLLLAASTASACWAFVGVPTTASTSPPVVVLRERTRSTNRRLSAAPSGERRTSPSTTTRILFSAVADRIEGTKVEERDDSDKTNRPQLASPAVKLSEDEYLRRLEAQLEKLRQKDQLSPLLTKEELNVVYEDEHIVAIDKPAGVLTVSGRDGAHSIAETVYEAIANEFPDCDRMVIHRLGMDTSGLLVLAKTMEAVRGMNAVFRTRTIERRYEALVCGHVKRNRGLVDLPLMRCYEHPPYMRTSTDEHQEALIGLDPNVVGKKVLEPPKESLTKYEVIAREELGGQPVTRVTLTSLSGRTHQLNTHLAALGHPIVGDTVYGCGEDGGDTTAALNGGLRDDELQYLVSNKQRATLEQQKVAAAAVEGRPLVHAKLLKFRHPVLKKDILLESEAPF